MKKNLLKLTMLLAMVMGCILPSMAAWQVKASWDFVAMGKANADKTPVSTFSDGTTVKLGSTECDVCTGDLEGLAFQGAGGWLLRSTGSLYQGNGGGRIVGVLNLKAGDKVTIVANGDFLSGITNGTSVFSDNTYTITVTEDGNVYGSFARNNYLYSIVVEENVVEAGEVYADYTLKYVDGEGNEIKEATVLNGLVGEAIEVSAGYEVPIYANGKKYIYVSNDAEGKTITEEGTVVTLTFRELAEYNYSLTNNVNDEVITGKGFEGDELLINYPQYILSNGTLWEALPINSAFQYPITLSEDNITAKLSYNETEITDVVYYVEAENVPEVNVATLINRASNGHMGHTGGSDKYKEITAIEPGKYVLYVKGVNSNNGTQECNFMVGDDIVYTFSFPKGNNVLGNSEEFTVTENATLSFASTGSSTSGVDWVYIQKTGEYVAPEPEMPDIVVIPGNGETIDGDLQKEPQFAIFFGNPGDEYALGGCESSLIEIAINGEPLEYETDWTADYYLLEEDGEVYSFPNGMMFTINEDAARNGEMTVTVGAGAFMVLSYEDNPENVTGLVGTNDEFTLTFTLENYPEKTVEPEPEPEPVEPVIVPSYTADTFEGIIIAFPGAEYANVDGYLFYSDEVALHDATWTYIAESFVIRQEETTFFLTPNPTPNVSGTYTLSLPEGLFKVDGVPSADTEIELTFEGFDPTVLFISDPADGDELEYEDFTSKHNYNSTIFLSMCIELGEVDVYAEETPNYLDKITVTMNGEALVSEKDWTITRNTAEMSFGDEDVEVEAPNMFNLWINPKKICDGELTVTIGEGAFQFRHFDEEYWEAYGDLGESEAYSFTLTIINTPTEGISSVIVNGVSTADVYTTSGVMVRKAGESLNGLAKGVYVTKGVKVLVK